MTRGTAMETIMATVMTTTAMVMAQSHSEQRNCSTTPRTMNGIIRRSDERRKGHR